MNCQRRDVWKTGDNSACNFPDAGLFFLHSAVSAMSCWSTGAACTEWPPMTYYSQRNKIEHFMGLSTHNIGKRKQLPQCQPKYCFFIPALERTSRFRREDCLISSILFIRPQTVSVFVVLRCLCRHIANVCITPAQWLHAANSSSNTGITCHTNIDWNHQIIII